MQFTIAALHLCNVRQQFCDRFVGRKVSFDNIFFFLYRIGCFCNTTRYSSLMQQVSFLHCTIYSSATAFNMFFLFKRREYSVNAVIIVVRVLINNILNFDQKKLAFTQFSTIFEPAVISGLINTEYAAK